mmetsp:Transcript_11301/g.23135  ORF Transcript_11301/g.23135 Transcript_11301/m.23135 type:complete len:260 (-) Transcript_11301:7-786(-)
MKLSPIVVYKATCLLSGKNYIGNTQQKVKTRIQQHVQDVKRLVIQGKSSDTFASHFASLVPKGTVRKEINNFCKMKIEIVWQGNPISCVKSFGTHTCKLCAKERMAVLHSVRNEPSMAINACTEVYGACRHKPRFHRYEHSAPSTDESAKDERIGSLPSSTTSASTLDSQDSLWKDNSPQCLISNKIEQVISGEAEINARKAMLAASTIDPSTMPLVDGLEPSPFDMIAVPLVGVCEQLMPALDLSGGGAGLVEDKLVY